MRLSLASEVNTAERVPMMILASPLAAARQASRRKLPLRAECITTTPALKRRSKRSTQLRRQRDFGHEHQGLTAAAASCERR